LIAASFARLLAACFWRDDLGLLLRVRARGAHFRRWVQFITHELISRRLIRCAAEETYVAPRRIV
jgi:hypothetical protein